MPQSIINRNTKHCQHRNHTHLSSIFLSVKFDTFECCLMLFPYSGVNGRGTLLRRSCSQVSSSKPAPPTRRTPSVISQESQGASEGEATPRGSMEFLPPPPPHLLHSDEEAEQEIVTRRGPSVAESIKELQRRGGGPPGAGSPGTLRRVQSMSAHSAHGATPERQQIMARLDAALAMRPASPGPGQDQIYAPVAALQQKIQQQQQARLAQAQPGLCDPGLVPHPPGPIMLQSTFTSPKSKQNVNDNDGGGSEYGFGMQFQVQSNNFYHQQHNTRPSQPQQHSYQPQQRSQMMHPQQHQMRSGVKGPQYPHDQIMSDMDPTLSQRPQPPDLHRGGWPGPHNSGHGGDPAAAKVRHWIETRTVSDVRKVRPVLNQEIQQGFQLRKATGVKDRSGPKIF